jgi:hypothetical protein
MSAMNTMTIAEEKRGRVPARVSGRRSVKLKTASELVIFRSGILIVVAYILRPEFCDQPTSELNHLNYGR